LQETKVAFFSSSAMQFVTISVAAALALSGGRLAAQAQLRGKVVMEGGAAPGKPIPIECAILPDGPISVLAFSDNSGKYQLSSTALTHPCRFRGRLENYVSSHFGPGDVRGSVLPDLVLRRRSDEPPPAAAAARWEEALKAEGDSQWAEAERRYREILKDFPDSAPVWSAIGFMLENQRKTPEARQAYQRAIEKNPHFIIAFVGLTQLEMNANDWVAAGKAAATGIQADTEGLASILRLYDAEIRQHLGDLDGAEASARQAIEMDLSHGLYRAEYILGSVLEAKHDNAGAVEHYNNYLRLAPTVSDAAEVRGRIERLSSKN
jgi:tetratricopeptide (TPR) repeat protein